MAKRSALSEPSHCWGGGQLVGARIMKDNEDTDLGPKQSLLINHPSSALNRSSNITVYGGGSDSLWFSEEKLFNSMVLKENYTAGAA